MYQSEMAGRQAALDGLTQRAARRIETRIEQHIALLSATRAFIEVQDGPVEHEVFAAFVKGLGLDDRYSGLQGLGLARLVTPGTEDEVKATLAQNYGPEAVIWPEPVPGLRTAITLLEPSDTRNRAAIGYDMATEERRRVAMLAALRTGEAAATAPLQLVQEITDDVQTGILIYLPLRPPTGSELGGFAYAPVRLGDLFTAALQGDDVPLVIHAVDADAPEPPLFEAPGYLAAKTASGLASQTQLAVAGRDWILSA
ncbi:CHASE domain-containing protein [Cereibacter changlensis]|uniref:CHASE domain-containing protein n=1 Tax=Cereibacter changlensis TaxID=402884 RepID=UPI00145CDE07|nr:CHASE domain-containing protein [Cereibacter changlensis]